MPRLRCPRCASVVDVAPGAAPACPSCGFGSKPASAPAPAPTAAPAAQPAYAAPAPYAAPPAAPAPAPAAGGRPPPRTGRIVAIAAVALLVLGGAAAATYLLAGGGGKAEPLTEAEARSRLEASLLAASDLFSGEAAGDDLVKMDARATPPEGGTDEPFGSFGSMHLVVEWGRDAAQQVTLDAANGPVTISFKMTCADDRRALEYGGEAYVSRRYVDGIDDCMDLFGDGEGMEDGFGEQGPSLEELEAEDAVITVRDDGTIHAEITQDGVAATIELDAKGRLVSVESESADEGSWTMAMSYGSRRELSLPSGAKPLPAEVETYQEPESGKRVWVVDESPHEPPLDEMEIRLRPYGFDFDDDFVDGSGGQDEEGAEADLDVLSFPAHVRGPQVQGNYTVEYHDNDGDGKVSAGDSWDLVDAAEAAEEEGDDPFGFSVSFPDYEVVLYDKPAKGYVDESPMGAPGLGWLALAALALGLAALRRR